MKTLVAPENNKQKRARIKLKMVLQDEKSSRRRIITKYRANCTEKRRRRKQVQKQQELEEFGRSSAAGCRGAETPRGTQERRRREERSETAGIKREEV